MAKELGYTFVVHGFGPFPFDMLRYDAAFPADDNAVTEIAYQRAWDEKAKPIRLRSQFPPTIARWRSFGWVCKLV